MKTILMRKKSAAAVVTASRRWAAATAQNLADLLRPELAEGEILPDLELLQELLGRALARRWQLLEVADQAREEARERLRRQTDEKMAARAVLYRRVVDLRRLLRGVFGGAACRRLLGIAGETSRDDIVLLRQARHIVARLTESQEALPAASFRVTADDLARWATPVEKAIGALHDALADAGQGARELEAQDAELRRAIGDYDSVLPRVAGLQAAFYTGAGRDQCARAVRPSRRRLGRLLTDDDRASQGRKLKGRSVKRRTLKGQTVKSRSERVRPQKGAGVTARRDLPRSSREARWADPAVALARAG